MEFTVAPRLCQQRDGFSDGVLLASLGADEYFLQAFGCLGDGLQTAWGSALNFDGAGGTPISKRFTAVGSTNDHADDARHRFDSTHGSVAFLGGTLVASAGGHGR